MKNQKEIQVQETSQSCESSTDFHQSDAPFKIRVFAQAVIYKKRKDPKEETRIFNGEDIPVQVWYDEFDCKQLAVNYNGLKITEENFDRLNKSLGEAIKADLRERDFIISDEPSCE